MFTNTEIMNNVFCGSALKLLKQYPDESINCCVTSPPYWALRNYDTTNHDDTYDIWCEGESCNCEHEWVLNDKKIHDYFCKKCNSWKGELGQEPTPELYIQHLTQIFHEIKRVLRADGTLWVNLGDSYYKKDYPKHPILKGKDLIGIPWLLALSLQRDGWYLRNDIIWDKIEAKPESITDRCTKVHEYIFFFTKSEKYFYDQDSIRERCEYNTRKPKRYKNEDARTVNVGSISHPNPKGKNKSTLWRAHAVCHDPFFYEMRKSDDVYHSAMYSEELITPCVLAGCPEGGIVFDPFMGSGTTGAVALKTKRKYSGTEINPDYINIQNKRFSSIDLDRVYGNSGINEIFEFVE